MHGSRGHSNPLGARTIDERVLAAQLLSGIRIERDQAPVERAHIDFALPHRDAPIDDVTILDTDLTRCAPEQLARAKVLSTLIDG
jgi:hypothetical protein